AAVAVALSAAPAAAQETRGRKFALLVGVRSYRGDEGLGNLKHSEADVNALADWLRTKGGFRLVTVLTQTAGANNPELLPTADNIETALQAMLDGCQPGDTVLVGFSGHGVQIGPDGKQVVFLCPMDARLTQAKNLLALSDIYGRL